MRKLHYIYDEEVKKMPFALNLNMSSQEKKAIENRVVEHFAGQGCNCYYREQPHKEIEGSAMNVKEKTKTEKDIIRKFLNDNKGKYICPVAMLWLANKLS